ncbi:MAG: zinc ABC transporter ATP-binding protein ZnuC [Alphaproteobacteria bacterium CG11_big_fil_rev_8_21_14_0_20_39_49]|nr:MAG: zinc ABC transporter ATP-binding protein ZnuC [Alphaproteobacteria bacterium CG11_big_fil_rev_8_21_14_0_20_39_49]
MTKELINCKDISVSFGGRDVLKGVSLIVSKKEIVTIIGPNGSGKTTLLKTICGIQQSTKGKVKVSKNTVIGYMPQKIHIEKILPLTVRRFLRLNGTSKKLRSIEDVESIAIKFNISNILKQQVHDISGGEMQRVMLARAVLLHPDLLILDEPTQGLDINGQAEFYNLISHIRDEIGCGIIMVSHDLHMVMASTDKVVCINQHICCEGTPEDINEHPEYIALFGKKNAENVAIYTHNHDHVHDQIGCVDGDKNA